MRTAPRWFLRRAHQLFPSNSSDTIFLQRSLHNVASNLNRQRLLLRPLSHSLSFSTGRPLHTDGATSIPPFAATDESTVISASVDTQEPKETPKLSRWMLQLNQYLPADVRISLSEELLPQEDASDLPLSLGPRRLEKLISRARSEDTEVMLWLVGNGHRKTALWLMESILNYPSLKKTPQTLKSPSNIDWPQDLFASVRKSAIDVSQVAHPRFESISNDHDFEPGYFASKEAQAEHRLLSRVWETLGELVIQSAAAGKGDTIDDNMLTALLVLGQIHNLGLMPDDVYAYNSQHQPTFFQRPPILNLVSSHILTALSDVAWRQQQDDAILQAAHMGMSLKEISKSVPGGRFRLRVRPLDPAVWLELILWCCIESDQTTAAVTIIRKLATQTEEPWFAVRWSSPQSRDKLDTLIDWNKMKLRHGGPGGLIEGYSREKPLVDVPEKTISIEVVLALVEKLIITNLPSSLVNTSRLDTLPVLKDVRTLRKTIDDIEDVLTFLEPHDLPTEYFDYLETRLLQDNAFDLARAPIELHTWSTQMASIRNLEKIDVEKPFRQTLGVEEISAHNQLHIGFRHQVMSALVQFGDVHHTLAVFNEIQESIDKTKVASITDFLQQQPMPKGDTPNSNLNHELEFTGSHGQLPYHKLAGFLNLISDTKLIGLGRWLLYADDVDGAALPEQARDQPCMTAALYKFAAVSQDEALLKSIRPKKHYQGWKPTVNTLRARFDASTSLLDIPSARKDLRLLKSSAGGGYGLSNVVHIAATILRLEHSMAGTLEQSNLNTMMEHMFYSHYDSDRADFTLAQRRLFKQQIHCILRVFAIFDGSLLQRFAKAFRHRFPPSNLPLLPAKLFNVLLSVAVDTRGATFGQEMWKTFCKTPDTPWAIELLDFDAENFDSNDDLDPLAESDSPVEPGPSVIRFELDTPERGLSHDPVRPIPNVVHFKPRKSLGKSPLQQHDQTDPSEDLKIFKNPFFPQDSIKSEDTSELVSSHKMDNESFKAAFIGGTDVPLTIPNLQTLRIIVRAAATEMKDREEAGQDTKVQEQQMVWAVQIFKAFGVVDKTVVEQEVQYPLNELDAKMIEESEEMIEAARQREAYRLEWEQDLKVGAPVSPMWAPMTEDTRES